MIVLTVVVTSLICLIFNTTRVIGVVGIALLFLLHPLLFIALTVIGGVTLHFINQRDRS